MRIQSKFKDYYDFISHRYGADPDCTYVREPIGVCEVPWKPATRDEFRDTFARREGFGRKSVPLLIAYHMEWVVAGPHVVAFLCRHRTDGPDRKEWLAEAHYPLLEKDYRDRPVLPDLPSGERLAGLIRDVGHPVFTVRKRCEHGVRDRSYTLLIDERVPVLRDIGFSSRVSPEQMWQDIYATLTNVLRENPDKAPPVQVGERYRIEGAGFDLKTSFRHPVNSPAAAAKRRR